MNRQKQFRELFRFPEDIRLRSSKSSVQRLREHIFAKTEEFAKMEEFAKPFLPVHMEPTVGRIF